MKTAKILSIISTVVFLILSACGDPEIKLAAPGAAGDLVITEIMINPDALDDIAGEWFEIYNPSSDTAYNLEGMIISDAGTDSYAISSDLLIYPHEYLTLAASADPGFEEDYVYSSFSLGNTNDEIILTYSGTEIDSVVYTAAFPISTGASMELISGHISDTDNDDETNWAESSVSYNGDLGTPGAANSN